MKATCITAPILVVGTLAPRITLSQTSFWQPMNNGLTNLNIPALAVDSGGVLYAAAGFDSV